MDNLFIIIPLLILLMLFFVKGPRLKTFFNYREAHDHEWNILKEIGRESYGQYKTVLEPQHFKTLEGNLERNETWHRLFEKATPFVCESNNTIVGMAFLVPSGNPDDIYPADACHIRMVGVLPDYAGRGIARKLTQLCITRAKESGERQVMLHTSEFMDAARHIYESLGFTVLREIEPRFGKRYWLYKLEL